MFMQGVGRGRGFFGKGLVGMPAGPSRSHFGRGGGFQGVSAGAGMKPTRFSNDKYAPWTDHPRISSTNNQFPPDDLDLPRRTVPDIVFFRSYPDPHHASAACFALRFQPCGEVASLSRMLKFIYIVFAHFPPQTTGTAVNTFLEHGIC